MKKILLSFVVASTLMLSMAGCLKDEGFENQQYGTQIKEIKGVAFPQAAVSPVSVGVSAQTASQTFSGPIITVEADQAPASDVKVTLVVDMSLVTAAGLTPLPAGSYTVSGLSATIPAGTKSNTGVTVTIPNASTLDPNIKYGIGFKIASVDQGYIIANNQKEIVFAVVVNHPLAGTYDVTGYFFHPSAPRAIADEKKITTQSATVVRAGLGDLYPANYYFDFSLDASNNLVNWVPVGATPPIPQSGFMTMDVVNPGGVVFSPKAPGTAPYVHSTYNNKYDPATKTIWMHYGYGVGSTGESGYTRQVYEKWVRK